MHPDIERLIELDHADREIRRLNEEIDTLPKRVAAIEDKLAHIRSQLEQERAAIKAAEIGRRKFESEVLSLQQKISKYREQSLAVKTNEQYRALMHEIGFAERDIRGLEDKILDGMVDVEAREKEVKALEAELKARTAEVEKEKVETRARTSEDEAQLAEWNGKRDQLRETISAEILRHYDRVLKLRGSALAEANEQKCSACRVMLRPQVYNDVRSGEQVVVCDSCSRILYYDASREPEAARARSVANGAGETSASR